MKALLEFDPGNVSEEYIRMFGSRPGTFFYILVRKAMTFAIISVIVVALYVFGRSFVPTRMMLRVCDYVLAFLSFSFLVFLVHKIASSWVKSGWRRLSVDYEMIPREILKATVVLLVAAAHFVVVYVVSIRCIYEGLNDRGVFGDSFGALNSLVSTGALIGVLLTLWLQYRQQMEDRCTNARRQIDEKRQAEDRRRERWPVVVTKDLAGTVALSGVNENGNPLFEFTIKFTAFNCSRIVLLNVANSINVQCLVSKNPPFVQHSPICTYIEDHGPRPFSMTFIVPILNDTIKLTEFLDKDNATLRIKYVFGTALQFYYSVDEQYLVGIDSDVETANLPFVWKDALSTVQRKFFARKGTVTEMNELLCKELDRLGVSKNSQIGIKFRAQPKEYKLCEITEEQFSRQIESNAF